MNKEIITRNFSRYAYLYDRYANVQSKAARELLDSITQDRLKRILEVGCGTGNYTLLLRERFRAARIKATDLSKKMVEVAQAKLKDKGIDFLVADSEKIELEESFDLITSNACFQWFADLEQALPKFKRALGSQGVLAFSLFGPLTLWELSFSLKSFFGEVALPADNFINRKKIEELLDRDFRDSSVREVKYEESFSDLKSLLYQLKYTGVGGEGLSDKFYFSRKTLAQVEGIYRERFGQIKATFQAFFCRGSV